MRFLPTTSEASVSAQNWLHHLDIEDNDIPRTRRRSSGAPAAPCRAPPLCPVARCRCRCFCDKLAKDRTLSNDKRHGNERLQAAYGFVWQTLHMSITSQTVLRTPHASCSFQAAHVVDWQTLTMSLCGRWYNAWSCSTSSSSSSISSSSSSSSK